MEAPGSGERCFSCQDVLIKSNTDDDILKGLVRGKSSPGTGSSREKLPKNALVRGQQQPGTHTSLRRQPTAPRKVERSLTTQGMAASVDMATRDAAAGTAGQQFAIGRMGKCLIDLKNTNHTHTLSLSLTPPCAAKLNNDVIVVGEKQHNLYPGCQGEGGERV